MRRAALTLTKWEVDRLIELLTEGPQNIEDRDLYLKLSTAKYRLWKGRK